MYILELTLGGATYALPAERVVEIAPRVAVTPLHDAPSCAIGYVAYRGEPVVAVDLRARFGLPAREPSLEDHFVVARLERRLAVIVTDRVVGLRAIDDAARRPPVGDGSRIAGVVALADGVMLIVDLDALVSLDEDRRIDAAMPTEVA